MKLLAVDSNSIMNRAFYGIKLLTTKKGFYTNAIFGFLSILLSTLAELKPDAVVFAFDVHSPTFRHDMYDGYKAGRHPTPPELLAQFPLIKELLKELGYPILECAGWEADDILGTLARDCERGGDECVITTGDRDSLQLITSKISVRLATTKMGQPSAELMDEASVMEKYGVPPKALIEVKALMGDSSDNIPGVAGVGEKTALALIAKYQSVEYIYAHLEELDIRPAVRAKLVAGRESAFLSRSLGTIACDVPIPHDVSGYMRRTPDDGAAAALLARLEMWKMIERLGLDATKEPLAKSSGADDAADSAAAAAGAADADSASDADASNPVLPGEACAPTPRLAARVVSASELAAASLCSAFDILADFDGEDLLSAVLISGDEALFCVNDGLFFDSGFVAVLSCPAKKRTEDLKQLCRWAESHGGQVVNCVMDSGLAGYILNVTATDYSVERLATEYGALRVEISGELAGAPKSAEADALLPFSALLRRAEVFSSLCDLLQKQISDNGEDFLLSEIELPLAAVLASMEIRGFEIDPEGLRKFGEELSGELDACEERIYELCGEKFKILSPKQLGEVLFSPDKLNLPAKKKTKSGYSTDAEVLEGLRAYHPAIDLILEYRKLSKLRSTYVDGLLSALAPDGRIHTRFNQKETRTGRISSLEPNLQNIPIRTELGSRLRGFFRAKEGSLLVDADYSQIELRVLAHIADDEHMKRAFIDGTDIHTQTAAQVFGMPEDFITPQLRSRAKAVNFGIVYGIGAFSLANNIDVPVAEAKSYIESYLANYSGVDRYMKRAIEDAKGRGYAETLSGRRRALPELASSNHNLRAFGERVARNMPIQGAAADIIKLAMVRVSRRLREEKLEAFLILQVHDELIVEAAEGCRERATAVLREEMESAMQLSVPLLVDVGTGKTWLEAH